MKKPELEQKQSVLVIDDNQKDINSLKVFLKKEYKITTATTEEKVFKAIGKKTPPDLILFNKVMEGMDGELLCKKLKSGPETWNIPVIFITPKPDEEEESKVFQMGAADYIVKPYNPLVVAARVRTHAEMKKYRDCLEVSYYLDGLTAIPNARRFEEYYDSVWSFAARESLPLSLIKISIADFDQFCDHYGQQAGDECLVQITKSLSLAAKRKTDMIARCGREEFICVLPNTRIDGAIILAESFRASVLSLQIPNCFTEAKGLVSINQGVATTTPSNDMDPKALMKATDKAHAISQEEGCNQINCKSI